MISNFDKIIWVLWLQGWKNAPVMVKSVIQSWEKNCPEWTINFVDQENLNSFLPDLSYINDNKKNITLQAKSDIIRLSLLEKYGGVWIDSTLLGFHKLDSWVNDELLKTGIWMYHGNGAKMSGKIGPASWFIIAKKNNYIIKKWKKKCDEYWVNRSFTDNYFWMDYLFKELIVSDINFKKLWNEVPYLYCESYVQSHYFSTFERMRRNSTIVKKRLEKKPPYVLKLWLTWMNIFEFEMTNEKKMSNGYFAYKLSLRNFDWPNHNYLKKDTSKFLFVFFIYNIKYVMNYYCNAFYYFINNPKIIKKYINISNNK